MGLEQALEKYSYYDVVAIIDLDDWYMRPSYQRELWLKSKLEEVYKWAYKDNERIIFTSLTEHNQKLFDTFLRLLSTVDISDYFVVLLTNQQYSTSREITIVNIDEPLNETQEVERMSYDYNNWHPVKIAEGDLSELETHYLRDSKTFCIYPWVHLHAYPTGNAYPCCHAEMQYPCGSTKMNTLEEIWHGDLMKELRANMIAGVESPVCKRCYEQESYGFFSGRRSANKHHGHHINRAVTVDPEFKMTYWDIRFSNLCNLSCRTCGHIFSSSWYQDQCKLAGPEWAKDHKALNFAGKYETDMIEQVMEHIDYVEQIYFAGGEPLTMEEHYIILEELERRNKFHVRLIYNTNFTKTRLKDRDVFDYWRKFDSVSVGASLDAMGKHAEYIRKGTKWETVEENRRKMLEVCPNVDFYISPTLSIMNAMHLPDFHRDWVEKGLLQPQALNVNILQDPAHYRIDIAPAEYKAELKRLYEGHIQWLKPQDGLNRATIGFESAIKFMDATDNSYLLNKFWEKTAQLDEIRNESIYDFIPEIEQLHQ